MSLETWRDATFTQHEARLGPPKESAAAVGRILVVDDEILPRELVAWLLRRSGHWTLATGSGRTALALASMLPLDLALVDLKMPDMSGRELLRELRRVRPGIGVALLAGCSQSELALIDDEDPTPIVEKPVSQEELLAVVEAALAGAHT
jgi:CheY-like chemotaxis protein